MKKLALLLLALLLVFTASVAMADMNAPEYLAVEAQELPDAEDMFINYEDYYGQVLHGYYNFDCYVNENVTRTAKFYIPEGTVYNQPTVFITVPSGVNTWGFFVESGWKDAADKYVFHAVLAEPVDQQWGDIESEVEYLAALRDDVSYRPFFVSFSSNFYAVGYGDAADVLMKHSMSKPLQWACAACIGITGIDDEYLASRATTPSKEAGVMMSEVSMPMFITATEKTEAVQKVIDYWKKADNVEDVAYSCSYADEVYFEGFYTTKEAMDYEPINRVYYSTAATEKYYEAETIDHIYNDFLCKYMQYPGTGNGSLRTNADIYEVGFQKFEGMVWGGYDTENKSDMYKREWFVYVPSTVNPDVPAPVVFDFHGAGGTGNEIAGRTGWIKVAEDRGVILVCPTGSHTLSIRNVSDITTNELFRCMWNTGAATEGTPDDKLFIRDLYAWMCENYNIDTGRVYATGQSSGGAMSHAMAGYCPDIFAACAPVSALATPKDYVETDNVALMVCIGCGDPYFKAAGFGGDSAGFSDGKGVVTYWTNRYNTVKKWEDFTYMNDNAVCSFVTGNFRNYVFATKTGVPMLRCVETMGKVHAYLPSEAYMIWDECFAQFTKDAEGNLYYQNTLVVID